MNIEDQTNSLDKDDTNKNSSEEETRDIDDVNEILNGNKIENNNSIKTYDGENGLITFIEGIKSEKPTKKQSKKTNNENLILIDNLNTILKKIDQLQRDVNILMERGKRTGNKVNNEVLEAFTSNLPNFNSAKMDKNDTTMPRLDVVEEFISIYHSSTIKKSISINKELEEKIKKLISKHYGVTDNDSKIINIALMIALLKTH